MKNSNKKEKKEEKRDRDISSEGAEQ